MNAMWKYMEVCGVHPSLVLTIKRFIRFGMVGAGGVVVDMGVFFLLADPKMLDLNLSLSKALAAETAIVNNFVWNDLWTFHDISAGQNSWRARLSRFSKFNLICLAGIGLNILLLNGQVHLLHMNVYIANLIAIFLVSLWNFGMNLKFGWRKPPQKIAAAIKKTHDKNVPAETN